MVRAFEPDVMGAARSSFPATAAGNASEAISGLCRRENWPPIDEGPDPAEILCHYCGSVYRFGKDELRSIFKA
jgi:hypothetical protein